MYTAINGRKETWLCGTTGTLLARLIFISLLFRATLHYGVFDYGPEQVRKCHLSFRQVDKFIFFKGEIDA